MYLNRIYFLLFFSLLAEFNNSATQKYLNSAADLQKNNNAH